MHVGMHACMKSEGKSELDKQMSGILRKENKQTSILVCLCMYVCMRSESESASHSSLPQLNGVRVISACVCAHARLRWYYFANLSILSVCLPVHTRSPWHKHTHTQTQATLKTQANTCHVMIENQHFYWSTVSEYSITSNTHTYKSNESPAKTPAGRADNRLPDKRRVLYRGHTGS
jgi:hypothetical protein